MRAALLTLGLVIARLQKFYGAPKPPRITDPLEVILFENVAYLADDEKREAAFVALKKRVGTTPQKILQASRETLLEVTTLGGIVPALRADRLRKIAHLAHTVFDDDLGAVVKLPLPQAKKALRRFPAIGEPGAEKILMLAGGAPVLALESNGLRVLLRLGFAREEKSYAANYRAVQQAIRSQVPKKASEIIAAHQLLRQHGQTLCKRNRPLCEQCPLRKDCPYPDSAKRNP
jgi:endonuclease III